MQECTFYHISLIHCMIAMQEHRKSGLGLCTIFFPSEVQLWQIKKKLVSHDSKTTYIATTLFKIFFTTCSEWKTEIASPRKIERTSLTLCPYHVSVSGKHSWKLLGFVAFSFPGWQTRNEVSVEKYFRPRLGTREERSLLYWARDITYSPVNNL